MDVYAQMNISSPKIIIHYAQTTTSSSIGMIIQGTSLYIFRRNGVTGKDVRCTLYIILRFILLY